MCMEDLTASVQGREAFCMPHASFEVHLISNKRGIVILARVL